MATTIVTKSGSGAPTASDLVAGELAVDLTNGRLYTEDSGGSVIEIGLNPSGNVDITGSATMDGLTVDGDAVINDTIPQLQLMESDTTDLNSVLKTTAGQFRIQTINDAANSTTNRFIIDHSTGDISFFEDTGSTAKLFWDSSAERLVIGDNTVSPSGDAGDLVVGGSTGNNGITIGSATTGSGSVRFADTGGTGRGIVFYDHSSDFMALHTAGTEKMHIDASGNVGIGTNSPSSLQAGAENLVVGSGSGDEGITIYSGNASRGNIYFADGTTSTDPYRGQINYFHDSDYLRFVTAATEAMRIDVSGNLLVGTTATLPAETNVEGIALSAGSYGGLLSVSRAGNRAATFNRIASDGDIAEFRKDSTIVGSIGTVVNFLTIGTADSGLLFNSSDDAVQPWNTTTNAARDAAIDLGRSSHRFKDLYLSGGVRNVNGDGFNVGTSGGEPILMPADTSGVLNGQGSLGLPSYRWKDLYLSGGVSTNTATGLSITADATNRGILNLSTSQSYQLIGGSHYGYTGYKTGGYHRWFGSDVGEDMRLDASGNLLVGTATASISATNNTGAVIVPNGASQFSRDGGHTLDINRVQDGEIVRFRSAGNVEGSISISGSTTSYNTSSDYRLKENVVGMSGATERLKQLKPSRFNFITDADTTVDGFLAHEVQDIVPEAISGTKDAVDADGNPEYQGIDQSKLVPLLVATIQELEARIAALES